MKCNARALLCALLSISATGGVGAASSPGAYPSRPIRVIVPQSAGGGTDVNTRLVAHALSERLGQSVVVDNRAGAGSLIGTEMAAKAAPDGYTLLAISSTLTILPGMYRKLPFDPIRDFAPVTLLTSFANVVIVPPAFPASSVKDVIALAKAKPGALNFASAGTGTPTHLAGELFKSMAGINIVQVPYKGGGPALGALLAGEVQLYIGPIVTTLPHVKSGKVKALAVTTLKRASVAPELPTVSESGLPGYEQITWNALFAPARTPPAIVRVLQREVAAVLTLPEMRQRFAAEGVEVGGGSAEELAVMVKNDIVKWTRIIQQAGIKPE